MSIAQLARALLPALCAAMIMVLSMPVNATVALDGSVVVDAYGHQHHDDCGNEPLHAIGCCTVALCVPEGTAGADEPYAARLDHGLHLDSIAAVATVFSDLFRPPRIV
ncbi:hypothetical protein [Devosia rhizoryzae]|uniref:DUF2946 domain-containing protein n=1 Tax=Devosia rhizoryzae TaxID=2774137 RepID=A0ABX7CBF0_9HYPH|nr:hypothetical protein [Devosia rhizoryzae]QQR40092.1 hypothetical protein JI748_03505 [Devosia rhizoryzae]